MTNSYDGYDFTTFQELAKKDSLSRHEKVGFPNQYRENQEELIFKDICSKITSIQRTGQSILEIGPGCSNITKYLIWHAQLKKSVVHLVDGKAMLELIPSQDNVIKVPGKFPNNLGSFHFNNLKFDAILVYSVIQYPYAEGNAYMFVDTCMSLLNDGGQLLIGDIPNISMRKRFFASNTGALHHRKFTGENKNPKVNFNTLEIGKIDDSFIMSIIARARGFGYHGWVLPQGKDLQMANRREDILIYKP